MKMRFLLLGLIVLACAPPTAVNAAPTSSGLSEAFCRDYATTTLDALRKNRETRYGKDRFIPTAYTPTPEINRQQLIDIRTEKCMNEGTWDDADGARIYGVTK